MIIFVIIKFHLQEKSPEEGFPHSQRGLKAWYNNKILGYEVVTF